MKSGLKKYLDAKNRAGRELLEMYGSSLLRDALGGEDLGRYGAEGAGLAGFFGIAPEKVTVDIGVEDIGLAGMGSGRGRGRPRKQTPSGSAEGYKNLSWFFFKVAQGGSPFYRELSGALRKEAESGKHNFIEKTRRGYRVKLGNAPKAERLVREVAKDLKK